MTTARQSRRGTTVQHASFVGLEGEITIDTTKDTAVVHDGATAGGRPLAREDLNNANPSSLSALTGAGTASGDLFVIYDVSAGAMKTITRAELNNAIAIEALDTVDINGGTIDGTVIGGSSAAAGTFTTLAAGSGTFSSTITGSSAAGTWLQNQDSGTSANYMRFLNTGGAYYIGVENSVGGGSGALGGNAYALMLYAPENRTIQHLISGTVITSTSSTGLGIAGALDTTGNVTVGGNSAGITYVDLNTGSSGGQGPAFRLKKGGATIGAWAAESWLQGGANTSNWPVFFSEAGLGLKWAVNGSATTVMTLDASGNLGVGVTPDAWVGGAKGVVQLGSQGAVAFSTTFGTWLTNNAYYSAGGWTRTAANPTGTFMIDGQTFYWQTSATGAADSTFTPTTAMTLDASGTLSNTANKATDYSFITTNSNANPAGVHFNYSGGAPNGTGNNFLLCDDTGGTRLYIRSNGGLSNYQANDTNLSDLGIKTDFATFHGSDYSAKAWEFGKRMRDAWGRFKYIDQTHGDMNNGYGAQLVQAAAGADFPELVEMSEWGKDENGDAVMRLTVYDSDLMHIVGVNVTACQYRIEDLGVRVDDHAARLDNHETRLAAVEAVALH